MDFIIIFILILITGIGIYRGFVKEILGLFCFAGAIFLSIISNQWIIKNLLISIEDKYVASTIAYIAGFIIFALLIALINFFIIKLLKITKISFIDRFFGGLFGLLKGYIICVLIFFTIYSFNSIIVKDFEKNDLKNSEQNTPHFLKDSKTYKIFYNSMLQLDHIIKEFINKKEIEEKQKNENKEEIANDQNILKENYPEVKINENNDEIDKKTID